MVGCLVGEKQDEEKKIQVFVIGYRNYLLLRLYELTVMDLKIHIMFIFVFDLDGF